ISKDADQCDAHLRRQIWNFIRVCKRPVSGDFWLGAPPAYADYVRQWRTWGPANGLGQTMLTKQTVHIPDVVKGRAYAEGDPGRVATVDLGGVRTALVVPMLKDGDLVGAFVIYRQVVRPFTDKQIDLVQNLAAQAVIAIDNARLINELRESLQRQTAAADVLQVISSSPGDLEQVFKAMLATAVRICEANFGNLFLYRDRACRIVAMHNPPAAYAERWRQAPVVVLADNPQMPIARLATTKKVIHIVDLTRDPGYA